MYFIYVDVCIPLEGSVVATKKTTEKWTEKGVATREKATASTKRPHREPATSEATITLECRTGKDRRIANQRRKKQATVAVERRQLERRAKVNRRRQIDPTTCERDYSADEIEFMSALDDYKRRSGRMFPTCSEVLEVIKKLGYIKQPEILSPLPALPEMVSVTTVEESMV